MSRSLPLKMPSIIGAAPSQRRCLVVLTASNWVLLTSWCEGLKKHFLGQKSTPFFCCKKVLFDLMYSATNLRHHQAYVALARSCLRDEGDNCAGGVVKNVYVRMTVRALVRMCVCTSMRLAEIMLGTSFASFSSCNRTFWSKAKARTKRFPYLGCLLPQVDFKK